MITFYEPPFAAGAGIAILSGPLGCLVVLQSMAYFGSALSHAALLGIGIALGFFFSPDLKLAMLTITILSSLLLMSLSRYQQFSSDTILGILAHVSLALGIVVISIKLGICVDLMAILFGDILSISIQDIIWIYIGASLPLRYLLRSGGLY